MSTSSSTLSSARSSWTSLDSLRESLSTALAQVQVDGNIPAEHSTMTRLIRSASCDCRKEVEAINALHNQNQNHKRRIRDLISVLHESRDRIESLLGYKAAVSRNIEITSTPSISRLVTRESTTNDFIHVNRMSESERFDTSNTILRDFGDTNMALEDECAAEESD